MSAAALQPLTVAETLAAKIRTRSARVGIIGLGYVGCPLAVEFAHAGFAVTGIDLQEAKVAGINAGHSHIQDVPASTVRELVTAKKLRATTDFSAIADLDTIIFVFPRRCAKPKTRI